MNTLVAYFSASGNTKDVANKISKFCSCDIFEIKATPLYTKEDLDWTNDGSRSSKEMKDKSSRPLFEKTLSSVEKYDLIILGFPIWWYTVPHIINSFLESYDFSGKKIALFATSGGSGFGKTAEDLKVSCPKSKILSSTLLNPRSEEKIKEFLQEIYK